MGRASMDSKAKFPHLEDLGLTRCSFATETIEVIGQKCPRLKSFKLNSTYCVHGTFDNNDEAVAIGKSMPGLKTLQLIENRLTNKGLGAILDGCPELESLDLRKCFNLRLKGKVWERCVKRVKRLRLPQDNRGLSA